MLNIRYIIALGVLTVGFGSNLFCVTTADSVGGAQRFRSYVTADSNITIPKLVVVIDAFTTGLVAMSCGPLAHKDARVTFKANMLDKPDNPLVNVVRHHVWYNSHDRKHDLWADGNSNLEKNNAPGLSLVADLGAFVAADCALSTVADVLSANESVKKATHVIPEQYRRFLYQNGKMVLASGAARTFEMVIDEGVAGVNRNNAKDFGKDALVQCGIAASEEYLVNGFADYWLGKEDSNKKEILKFVCLGGALLALNSAIR